MTCSCTTCIAFRPNAVVGRCMRMRTLNLRMPLTLNALGSGYANHGWFQHPPGHFSQALIKTEPPGSKTPASLKLKWSQVSTSPNICPVLHLQQKETQSIYGASGVLWISLNPNEFSKIVLASSYRTSQQVEALTVSRCAFHKNILLWS